MDEKKQARHWQKDMDHTLEEWSHSRVHVHMMCIMIGLMTCLFCYFAGMPQLVLLLQSSAYPALPEVLDKFLKL
jgi:hypothetical protein